MKKIISLGVFCLLLTGFCCGQHWREISDTLQVNKAYFASGTEKKEWNDCRIAFKYDGDLDTLLHVLGEQHDANVETFKDGIVFHTELTSTPLWFYSEYYAFIRFYPEESVYTYHVAYPEALAKALKNGHLLHGIPTQYLHFCQQMLDEALKRSAP